MQYSRSITNPSAEIEPPVKEENKIQTSTTACCLVFILVETGTVCTNSDYCFKYCVGPNSSHVNTMHCVTLEYRLPHVLYDSKAKPRNPYHRPQATVLHDIVRCSVI